MNYRSLGRTGMMVSPVALGCYNFGGPTQEPTALEIVARALTAGINFFDTAGNYQNGASEELVGRAIKLHSARHNVILATKVHYPIGPGPNDQGNSRLHILRACELSLRRLGTDYIDLYQVHRPSFSVPPDETLGALTDLVRQGKVRYIGCSTHPAWKVMEALMVSEAKGFARYVSEQPPYNLLDRRIENELIPLCIAHNVGLIPYAPLAQGVLAGRYPDAEKFPADSRAALIGKQFVDRVNTRGVDVGRAFAELACTRNISAAALALAWVKDQPGITAPIFGPRTLEQFNDALPALTHSLSDDTRAACDHLVPAGSAVTDFHNASGWMKQTVGL